MLGFAPPGLGEEAGLGWAGLGMLCTRSVGEAEKRSGGEGCREAILNKDYPHRVLIRMLVSWSALVRASNTTVRPYDVVFNALVKDGAAISDRIEASFLATRPQRWLARWPFSPERATGDPTTPDTELDPGRDVLTSNPTPDLRMAHGGDCGESSEAW
jgi:hypothetical protein